MKNIVEIYLNNSDICETEVSYIDMDAICKELNNPTQPFMRIGDYLLKKEHIKMVELIEADERTEIVNNDAL